MTALLNALGVAGWVLPALVLWPLLASFGVYFFGRDASREEDLSDVPNDGLDAMVRKRPSGATSYDEIESSIQCRSKSESQMIMVRNRS